MGGGGGWLVCVGWRWDCGWWVMGGVGMTAQCVGWGLTPCSSLQVPPTWPHAIRHLPISLHPTQPKPTQPPTEAPTTHRRPPTTHHPPPTIPPPPTHTNHPPPPITHHPPPTIHHPPPSIHHPPPTTQHPPPTKNHQKTTTHHPPSRWTIELVFKNDLSTGFFPQKVHFPFTFQMISYIAKHMSSYFCPSGFCVTVEGKRPVDKCPSVKVININKY